MRPTRLLTTAALLTGLALVGCDKARPTLGGASGKTACTGCHGGQLDATGAPPYDLAGHDETWSTNALGVGAHYGHMSNAVGCFNCHKVPAAVSSPGHMGVPPAVVDFSSYVGANVSGAPAPLPWDRITHTCSNYCHGSTLPGGTHTTPDWLGGVSEAACGSCHFFGGNIQTVQPAGHPLTDILAPGSPPITSNTQCADCHPETVNKDGTINVASGKHANGVVDGGGGHPSNFADPTVHGPLATAGLANCEVCHGTDFNGGGPLNAPSCNACHTAAGHPGWQSECTFCHGDATRAPDATFPVVGSTRITANLAAPPVGSQGETNTVQNAVGAHLAHVQAGALAGSFSCVQCHGAALPTDTTHVNGQVLLAWGNLAASGTSPSPAAGNIPRLVPDTSLPVGCANYCHGATLSGGANTAPKWTDGPAAATCGNCHSLPMPYTAAGGFHPPRQDCASCHPGYQSNPTTASGVGAVNVALHVNGKADTVTLTCTTCHGSTSNPGGNAAPPVTTLGNTVDPDRVGAHQPHLATAFAGGGKGLACTECHPDNTGNTQHANGTVNIVWNLATTGGFSATPAAGALTPGTKNLSCSNYCHSPKPADTAATNMAPVWSAPGTVVCGSCHGLPPASTTGHPAGATSCGSCHPGYANGPTPASSATAVNAVAHLNGAIDVINLVCTSCHGDATRTPVASANTLDVNGKAIVLAAPPIDSLGATSGNLVGAHQAHVNQGDSPALSSALLCSNCHNPVPSAAGPHISGTASPVVFGNLATSNGATPTAYSTATKTCSNTYCHGGFPLGKSGNSPSWGTGTNSKLACTSCHGQGTTAAQPTYPHPQNITCASCHTGYTSTSVAAATHVDGQLTVATGGCTSCHGDLKVSGVSLTANTVAAAPGETGSATSVDTTGATATTSTGVGAHLAHLAKTDFRSAAIACTECHQLPPSNTDTSHATGVGTGGARATIVFGNLASTGGVVPTYSEPTCSSTYCHRPNASDTAATNASPSWIAPGSVVCGSCHGLPPASASGHPVIAAGTSCGNCHPGYTTSSVNAVAHINGVIDGGSESTGGVACSGCHTDTWTAMTTSKFSDGTTVATHHTLGTLAGTNDSPNDTATTWSSPLNGVAASARSCVNMCHDDHTHTATDATNTTAHNRDVYLNASSQANRAATTRTVATKDVTDYENTATGGMCLSCHTNPVDTSTPVQHPALSQAAYQASAHQGSSTNTAAGTGSQPWAYTLHDGSQFVRNCTKCHDGGVQPGTTLSTATALRAVHGSPYPSLLAGTTNPKGAAATFICYECHGNNGGVGYTYGGKNIYAESVKAGSSHPVNADASHSSVNEYASAAFGNKLGGAARHSSCLDCHDPHQARRGDHVQGSNTAGNVLQGAWGAKFGGTLANFATPTTSNFTKVTITAGTDLEATLCFKCHSSYYGTLPTSPSGGYTETDVARDFNPGNASFHPVLASNSGTIGNTKNILSPWSPTSLMTCTDCHASDTTTDPAGPHGSAAKFLLKGPNTTWDSTLAQNGGTMPAGTFCANCHSSSFANSRSVSHTNNNHDGVVCVTCHVLIPHGSGHVGMLASLPGGAGGNFASDSAPYADTTNLQLGIGSYPSATGTWQNSNCGCGSVSKGH